MQQAVVDTVVDAFVWPLQLLGLGSDEPQQLPLLEIPHNALVNHMIPALSNQEKGCLALTCHMLWQLVASTVTQLKFGDSHGKLCEVAKSPRVLQFTNVTCLQLTIRGWHDIGLGAPQLLLHLSRGLPKVQEVSIFDRSHEDVYEPLHTPGAGGLAQQVASSLWHAAATSVGAAGSSLPDATCEGCGYDTDLPDTSCVLMSLLALYPGLKKLEVYTKLFSVAEVATISRLPQLTSLTLNSEDGVAPGALCSLGQLSTLQELRLGDVDGNNPEDVTTLCDMVTRLTSLHMGYCPRLQPPVLRRLQQVHAAVQQYILEQQQLAEEERRMLEAQTAGLVTKTARAAQNAATAAAGAAANMIGMAGSSLLRVIPGSGSGREADHESSGPHLRKSEKMLIEAGVPYEALNNVGGGHSSSTALAAAAAAAPQPGSDSFSYQQQKAEQQRHTPAYTAPADIAAASTAAAAACGGNHNSSSNGSSNTQHHVRAVLESDADRGAPVTSASHSMPGINASKSAGPMFRLVTELSVNIDAEDGSEILYEMSQLALLESLLVDSTDEFSFDPGFQPFDQTTNLRKLAITMPMSLANTQSLSRCRELRDLLLCALPKDVLGKGSLVQVTRLELLDVSANPPSTDLLQAFPSVSHMIIQSGADDQTLGMIGNYMTSLVHLELYKLPAGYSQGGLRGIAGLMGLRTLKLELASPGNILGTRTRNMLSMHNPLMMPFGLMSEVASEMTAAAGSMGVPLVGTNPILAFAPPEDWGLLNMLPMGRSNTWFPSLKELSILGYVAAADKDLHALASLTALEILNMHLQRPRGLAGQVTLRGLWSLVEMHPKLSVIHLDGYMKTQLLVPGRVPGVGF